MSTSTIVIGAGITGLAAAWRLATLDRPFVLLEAEGRAGGVMRSERTADGFLLEWGPSTVESSDSLWQLARDSGTESMLEMASPAAKQRYILWGGRIHQVPMSPGALLSTRLLSLGGKLRLFAEPFIGRGGDERESALAMARRRLGKQVAERMVEPFLAGVYAGDADQLSARYALARLADLEIEHGSFIRGGIARARARRRAEAEPAPRGLVGASDGLQTWAESLRAQLDARAPGAVRLASGARKIRAREDGDSRFAVEVADGSSLPARDVILALPHGRILELLEDGAREAFAAGGTVRHASIGIQQWFFREQPSPSLPRGFGMLAARTEGSPFLGILTPSTIFPWRAPPGAALWTLFFGGARSPEMLERTTVERTDAARECLATLIGGEVIPDRVEEQVVQDGICLYELDHGRVIEAASALEAAHPGLHLAGSWRGGVGVPQRIACGRALAEQLD